MKRALAADEPDHQLEIRALTATATTGPSLGTLTLHHKLGNQPSFHWPITEISVDNRGIVLYDPGPLNLDAVADRILGDILFCGVSIASHDIDRGKLAALLAELRRSFAEQIAQRLLDEADDEAQCPSRDAVSRAIETWLREAAEIARALGEERR